MLPVPLHWACCKRMLEPRSQHYRDPCNLCSLQRPWIEVAARRLSCKEHNSTKDLMAATAALNKKSSSHLTPLCLCAELCCCSWQAVGAQGHTGALQEELTHIQPQTGAVNLLPACRDYAETKGSAWDTTTLGCWSTDGVEVLSVKRGVRKCSARQHVLSRPVFSKLPGCHCLLETSMQPGKPFPSETEALFILHFHFLLPGNFSL